MIYLHIYQEDNKYKALLTPDHKIKMKNTAKPIGTVELDNETPTGKKIWKGSEA